VGTENLDKIFNPRKIAVIGASDREKSVGAKLLRNLIGVGYKGVVYPVNPFRPTVQGITAYPNIRKIPWQVDLAIIATPAHTVPQIIDECGKAGVSGVIIVSAGFKETGEEGKALEKQIVEYKNQYNMRIIGPHSLGVMRPKIKLNATFANKTANSGKIAFISQSAALCASVLDWAAEAHVGFSAVVSVGSKLDVDFGDLIDYFGTDAQTTSIVLYMKSIKDARKFMSATRGFAKAKPVVVVKAGRFPESAEAALSHTGALCGEDAVYDAAFMRAGVVRVKAINDLFNCAEALAMQPNPKGSKLTIITNAGGPGIMATDFLIANGGKLSPLSSETIEALNNVLPSYCSILNPIDVLEEATADRFRKVMEICFKDPNSDGFLIIYTPQGVADPVETAKIILELSRQTTKPIVEYLGGKKSIFSKGEVNIVNALAKAGEGIILENLPTGYVSTSTEGIKLVTIGKVRNFGEGCACPLNFLTKILLKNLVLDKDEIVLVDTDAGIEHVGRGVEEGCDIILAVADPTAEALMLARILKETFQNLNKKFWLVLNKATPKIVSPVKEKAKEMNLEVNGVIRFDEEIFESCMDGRVLHAKEASVDVEEIMKKIGFV